MSRRTFRKGINTSAPAAEKTRRGLRSWWIAAPLTPTPIGSEPATGATLAQSQHIRASHLEEPVHGPSQSLDI